MKVQIFGGLLIAALAITSLAQAQTRTPAINHRQHTQERRINEGVRNGQLTRGEAHRLRGEENRISRQRNRYAASGRVTRGERRHLRHEENRTGREMYRDKHNKHLG